MTTPTCPACKAKFSHDAAAQRCRACGVPDEIAVGGLKALQAWQKAEGRPVTGASGFQRRRRKHGRPRNHRKAAY